MSYFSAPGSYPAAYPGPGPSGNPAPVQAAHPHVQPVQPGHPYAPVPGMEYRAGYASGDEIGFEREAPSSLETWFNFRNSGYLKGFVIGAGAALVLTNPTVQKAVVAGAVKIWSTVQGGVEEVKEQIQDIKAEMSQKE